MLGDLGLVQGVTSSGRLQVPIEHLVRAPQERIYDLGYWEEGLWPRAGEHSDDAQARAQLDSLLSGMAIRGRDGRRPFELPLARCSIDQRGLDRQSAAQWITEQGLGGERLRWYLEYATRDDFGASLKDTSAFALLHYFLAREDAQGKGAEFLTWPEGNGRLVEGMAALLSTPVQTGQVAVRVEQAATKAHVDTLDVASSVVTRWQADFVVLALPQYVVARLLAKDPARTARQAFRYSPWVVANLHLARVPHSRGFPPAWDNVQRGSPSLGYVNATHQLDRNTQSDTAWTWYLPLTDSDERVARARLLASTWGEWRDIVLDDLAPAHPGLIENVTRIDLRRWGHAMVKPTPGFLWGPERLAAAQPVGRVHFAHSDLSGMALYEEAHWQGVRAAEEIQAAMGIEGASLINDEAR